MWIRFPRINGDASKDVDASEVFFVECEHVPAHDGVEAWWLR
jgi:hypothetical protein